MSSRQKALKRKSETEIVPRKKLSAITIMCYDEKNVGVSGDVLDIQIFGCGERAQILVAAENKEFMFHYKLNTDNAWDPVQNWRLPCSTKENTFLHNYVQSRFEIFFDHDCLYYLDRERSQIDLTEIKD